MSAGCPKRRPAPALLTNPKADKGIPKKRRKSPRIIPERLPPV